MTPREPVDRALVAEPHPSHYLMHKYWARKPHNIVRAYVEHFSNQGEIVLDPFAGSGVTLIESLLAGRKAVAVDINPIASLITEATVVPVDLDAAQAAFRDLKKQLKPSIDHSFQTRCPRCGGFATSAYVVWENVAACPVCKEEIGLGTCEKAGTRFRCRSCASLVSIPYRAVTQERMIELRYVCTQCRDVRQARKVPDPEDLVVFERCINEDFESAIVSDRMFLSNRTLVYEGMSVGSLFTARNHRALSALMRAIRAIKDGSLRQLFEFTFTASVAQASRLIPYRNGLSTGGPAWTVSGFWVPNLHLELNAWNCFENRFAKVLRGKQSLAAALRTQTYRGAATFDDLSEDKNALILTHSSTDLTTKVPDATVDYIFTDPPYGDSVPYLEYCTLWVSWLGRCVDYEREIVISDSAEREKDIDNYRLLLRQALRECYRVLKPERWLSLTFHNRRLDVWSAIVSAAIDSGFELVNCVYQVPAVIPAKAQLSKDGSTVGDIILNFRKPGAANRRRVLPDRHAIDIILSEAEKIIAERGGIATTDELTRGIVIALLTNGHTDVAEHEIVKALKSRFDCNRSRWQLRVPRRHIIAETEQLDELVSAIVEECFRRDVRDLKAVMSEVLSKLHNGRSPSIKQVIRIYEQVRAAREHRLHGEIQLELPFT